MIWDWIKYNIRARAIQLSKREAKEREKKELESLKELTLGCTSKFIPPPWYKGEKRWEGVNGTPPRIFDMLQYFETI